MTKPPVHPRKTLSLPKKQQPVKRPPPAPALSPAAKKLTSLGQTRSKK